jgi:hypothetical protein
MLLRTFTRPLRQAILYSVMYVLLRQSTRQACALPDKASE